MNETYVESQGHHCSETHRAVCERCRYFSPWTTVLQRAIVWHDTHKHYRND